MKRTIPLLITAIAGLVLIISVFIPAFQQAGEEAAIWFDVLAAIAFILGGANLFRLQLQQISARQPGWGYAAITLLFFLVTLIAGLLKLGCPPEASVEAYGESSASLPASALPVFRIPMTSPAVRGDGAPLPKSVQQEIAVVGSGQDAELTFTGWMQQQQMEDLSGYQDTLEWKCQAERLAEQAQLPEGLAGKVRYDTGHHTLLFRGRMSDADRAALLEVLNSSPETTQAVDHLFEMSRRTTSITLTQVPERFSIPSSQQEVLQLDGKVLTVHGPMSSGQRENLARRWRDDPRIRHLTDLQRNELLDTLQKLGPNFTPSQLATFENFFASVWSGTDLQLVLNTAGIIDSEKKTACELLGEIQSGTRDPDLMKPAPPAVTLNQAQIDVLQEFVVSGVMTQTELGTRLEAAGDFTATQKAALTSFFVELPTVAEQYKALCFRLLNGGGLSAAQKDFLLNGSREQFLWRQEIGKLFISAHQVKFPWSGDYSAQGSPFWWLYEYILQPLMTTTFALLAFYVASAAFRAFRAKNVEAILLLGTAFIILLGRTSAGPALTGWIPDRFSAFRLDQMTAYIMSIFNTAGNRAIMIGIALGTVSTSLRVLLGIDRSYLGKDD